MDFGAWLSEQRRKAGETQRSLASKCGLTAGYLATLERNASEPPPLKTCKILARSLGIGWEEIWQYSFTARLKRWLRRQGYSGVRESDLLDFVKSIEHRGS